MKIAISIAILLFGFVLTADSVLKPAWKENFEEAEKGKNNRFTPKEWKLRAKMFTNTAVFDLKHDSQMNKYVLHMFSDVATGTYLRKVPNVDLNQYPVMRFCWRVTRLPTEADGRDNEKDDQAIGIYLGTGRFRQESIAYRWETVTPKGASGKASYGGGCVDVQWYALRNQTDSLNTWYTETVDVAKDYQNTYGYLPKSFAISVVCNSQNTKSIAEADLAWIEFLPREALNPPRKDTPNTPKTDSK